MWKDFSGTDVKYPEGKLDCFDSVRLKTYCYSCSCAIRYGGRRGNSSKEKGDGMDHRAIDGAPHLTMFLD